MMRQRKRAATVGLSLAAVVTLAIGGALVPAGAGADESQARQLDAVSQSFADALREAPETNATWAQLQLLPCNLATIAGLLVATPAEVRAALAPYDHLLAPALRNLTIAQEAHLAKQLKASQEAMARTLAARRVDAVASEWAGALRETQPVEPNLTLGTMFDAGLRMPQPTTLDGAPLHLAQLSPRTPEELAEPATDAAEERPAIDGEGEMLQDDEAPIEEEPLPPPPRQPEPDAEAAREANRALVEAQRAQEAGEAQAGQVFAQTQRTSDATPAAMPTRIAPAPRQTALNELVNVDFRDTDLQNVVAILATKAGINVVAGDQLEGTVTANLKGVTLRQAMETVLRLNNLGLVEEEGIFRIVPYSEAVATRRATQMVALTNADAREVVKVLDQVIAGSPDAQLVSIAANESANVVVLSAPEARLPELVALVSELDVAEPKLPTVTEAIKLNYASPADIAVLVEPILTPDVGAVAIDNRSQHVVITDLPVVLEQVRVLIETLDMPVKQVSIDAMIVDAVLNDGADTGVDWTARAVRSRNLRGDVISDLDQLEFGTNLGLGPNPAGVLTFGILDENVDIDATIQAEVRNTNGRLLSNPVLTTIENEPATITIAQEIPFVELTQTEQGGQQTSTEFKQIGTVLQVTPRVTHDDDVIVQVSAKESGVTGEVNGIPIEDLREVDTTLRVHDGQTIFIGGLRRDDTDRTVTKVPVLGDIPVVNFMFRNNQYSDTLTELLVFLTVNVIPQDLPNLTPFQRAQSEELENKPFNPDTQNDLFRDMVNPSRLRDPVWKFKRTQ